MLGFTETILSEIVLLAPLAASQTTSIDYCQALVDVLSICELETPSFTQLAATDQANCLCGSNLSTLPWGPATFDGLASDCAIQYATIDVTVAQDAASLAGLCTSFAPGAQSTVPPQTSIAASSSTGAAVPQGSVISIPVNTDTNPYTTPPNTDTDPYTTPASTSGPLPAATTVFSVVTLAQTTSSPSLTSNGAIKEHQYGLASIVYALILEVVVLIAI